MNRPNSAELLRVWEICAKQSANRRALTLLALQASTADPQSLAKIGIGARDSRLLDLRKALFGQRLECVTHCGTCGEKIELGFRTEDIRDRYAESGTYHLLEVDGLTIRFRLPDTTDLLAVEEESDEGTAIACLLERCILDVRSRDGELAVPILDRNAAESVSLKMSELDPQAEVRLELTCPACGCSAAAPFDIVSHLWADLDAWAKGYFPDIHQIAACYGWSEAAILELSDERRHAYLALIETRHPRSALS